MNEPMTGIFGMIILIIALLALCLSAMGYMTSAANTRVLEKLSSSDADVQDVQYVLYLGTNDKDTNEPAFTPDEAQEKAKEILLEHFEGFTIQEAHGGWVDGDTVYNEYMLVIYLSDTDLETVHEAAEDMIREFNQSSVLIQANRTTTEFYSG